MIENEFGKKIGGSKRDQWKTRGLTVEDLDEMNSAERDAYVVKDNVWPKVNCEDMLSDGKPITVVYFVKTLRDSISKTPALGNAVRYIESVKTLRSLAEDVSCNADIDMFFKKCEGSGFVSRVYGRSYSMEKKLQEVGGKKVFKAIASSAKNCEYDIKKKQFMYSSEEKVLADYEFITVMDPKVQFELPNKNVDPNEATYCMRVIPHGRVALYIKYTESQKFQPGTIIAIRNGYYFEGVYDTEAEAKADIVAKNLTGNTPAAKQTKPRKTKFLYKQLDRMTQSNAFEEPLSKTGDDYINDFKFYGGEFGNWLSEADRQKNLDMAYISFKNLAIALDVPLEKVSLGEKLSIAFGSRGRGNAMAHYEPLRKVINLTKWKGAGSLAHEYGHAFDFIVGDEKGCPKGMMNADGLKKMQYPEIAEVISIMMRKDNGMRTNYHENAKLFDSLYSKDGGYWSSAEEMFARAFACYVKDKLAEKGIVDDYLCGHAETCISIHNGSVVRAYPEGEERKKINAAIDLLIKKYLH